MKSLTPKEYWDNNAYNTGSGGKGRIAQLLPESIFTADLIHLLKKHTKKNASIFEVGVAPGINALTFARHLHLVPHGMDYSEGGVKQARENFRLQGKNPQHILHGDLFDASFRKKHKNKYDIVSSWGFVEHFDDYASVIRFHMDFLKPGGLLVIGVPNIVGINRVLSNNIEGLINHDIMSLPAIEKAFPKNARIIESTYAGGIFSIGLFHSKNWFLETLRLAIYLIQRLILDQIQRLFLLVNIRFTNKRLSPYMLVIGRKNG